VVVVVLFTVAGFQVPEIPLVDIKGKVGGVAPWQIGGTGLNVGVTDVLTVTFKVVEVAH
jgi:hypothetical protein